MIEVTIKAPNRAAIITCWSEIGGYVASELEEVEQVNVNMRHENTCENGHEWVKIPEWANVEICRRCDQPKK